MEEGGQVREEEKERGGKERSKGWEKGKRKEEGSKTLREGKANRPHSQRVLGLTGLPFLFWQDSKLDY